MSRNLIILLWVVLLASLFSSCVSVQEYQKMYINDEDMKLSSRRVERFEINFQTYREGAAGANSGKTGGGCGCN